MAVMDIIYEDKDVIVCYKPAGIPTQTKRLGQQDMESMLKNYLSRKGETPFVGIVHRLDQPVEGIMVFAKTRESAGALSAQVKEHEFGKHYYAVCRGAVQPGSAGELIDYIVFDARTNVSRIVPKDTADKGAKRAVLSYRTEGTVPFDESLNLDFGLDEGEHCYLFDIALQTGRHHQIRIQLAHRGWSIIGDRKYGRGEHCQLALCSYRIEFEHPRTGEQMDFQIRPKNPLYR